MRSLLIYSVVLCGLLASSACAIPIIPRPESVINTGDAWVLREDAAVVGAEDHWIAALETATGFGLREGAPGASDAIRFCDAADLPDSLRRGDKEGYVLRVHSGGVDIHATSQAGQEYGLRSLVQLIEAAPEVDGGWRLAGQVIVDKPRFAWRGFMLDESRHFSGTEAVKRLLDQMARYKLNRFHWHLTDSAAWRIEIEGYPELTETGSRGSETNRDPEAPPQYYSQEEIREIVAYAERRQITVVPEIDMPGHADAAVRAYPEHGGGGYEKWPNFTFNPARPETLAFLDEVLSEVAELFPKAGVIHFGGDEVHFGWGKWTELPAVRSLMEDEGFTGLAEVEAWFNRRMAARINELGFITGGWDEISARDLPREETLVFWWRHDKPEVLRSALDRGFPVVLCPRRPLYFDFVQNTDHRVGRRWGGFNPLDKVYAFPESLEVLEDGDMARIRGVQANLWTETTVTQARRDFMSFPRLLALAEIAWTSEARKDFGDFERRLKVEMPKLKAAGLHPYHPFEERKEIRR